MKKWILTMCLVFCAGCGSDLMTGVGIGVGTSAGMGEAQSLAEKNKAALVGEILRLRAEVNQATDPAEVAALQRKIAQLEKQEEIANIVTAVTDGVNEGLQRDWTATDPNVVADNAHWLIIALGGLFGWEKVRSNKKNDKIVELAKEAGKNGA